MLKQAILLAQIPHPVKPSQNFFQWHMMTGSSYSGGTASAYTEFLIKSFDTCSLAILNFLFL